MTAPTIHHAPRRHERSTPKLELGENVVPASSDSPVSPTAASIDPERRRAMISDAAYFLSERRGFCPGHELDDWLAAERDIDQLLSSGQSGFERDRRSPARSPSNRHRLRARSQQLRSEIHNTLLRVDPEQYAWIAVEVRDAEEDGLAELLVYVDLAEVTRDVDELRDIEAALLRLAMGTYGVCVNCFEPIAHERLEAYPTANRCLPCQRLHAQSRTVPPTPSV